jgi:hypothetical protein
LLWGAFYRFIGTQRAEKKGNGTHSASPNKSGLLKSAVVLLVARKG